MSEDVSQPYWVSNVRRETRNTHAIRGEPVKFQAAALSSPKNFCDQQGKKVKFKVYIPYMKIERFGKFLEQNWVEFSRVRV